MKRIGNSNEMQAEKALRRILSKQKMGYNTTHSFIFLYDKSLSEINGKER